jgi:hypothetical protein
MVRFLVFVDDYLKKLGLIAFRIIPDAPSKAIPAITLQMID